VKLLVLNHEFPPVGGGAGNACCHTCRELVRQGAEVTVVTTAFCDLPVSEDVDGVRVLRVPSRRRLALESSSLELISYTRHALRAARELAGHDRFDVVHAYFGLPSGAVAAALKRATGLPFVISLRGRDVHGGRGLDSTGLRQPLRTVSRAVWRKADTLVANSHGLRRIARRVLPDADVDVIPNGVDTTRFTPASHPAEGRVRLLFAGRLESYKGPDVLLEALRILSERPDVTPFELRVVGDGSLRRILPDRARALGIAERVIFTGQVMPVAMPGVYRSADLFVLPSRVEGMPNGVLEAMASGLPTVGTRIPGSEELVTAETGRLVDAGDPDELAAALADYIADPNMRLQAGRSARREAEARSWSSVAEAYLSLFHRIAGATEPCVASAAS